jgi:hypothetical protein
MARAVSLLARGVIAPPTRNHAHVTLCLVIQLFSSP